jgi:hypothetical protein
VEPEEPAAMQATIQRFLDATPNLNDYLRQLSRAP